MGVGYWRCDWHQIGFGIELNLMGEFMRVFFGPFTYCRTWALVEEPEADYDKTQLDVKTSKEIT